nr:uncharacterized mitochondrial protein AtMg00810-like [Tanacetum cinerariifolium]
MNRKAFKVFNSRTRIVEETLHITFLENKPNVAGSEPTWIIDIDTLTKSINYKPVVAGNQSNGSTGKARVKTVPDKDYILQPLWTQDPLFSSSSKDSPGDGFKPSGEEENKDTEGPGNEESEAPITKETRVNQEKDSVNKTNRVNAVSSTVNAASNKVNDVGRKSSIDLPDDPNMPDLEDISLFEDSNKDVSSMDVKSAFLYGKIEEEDRGNQLFLAYASFMRFIVYQMDVKSAFLYGTIKEEVYVCQPHGFEDPYFPNKKNDGIFISQDKYVADILKKFDFFLVKTTSTLMKTNKALLKDEEAVDIDVYLYRSVVGSLMYLTAFRHDIMFAVCTYARFQVTPKVSHLHAVKRIFRYLKGQPKLGLWYPPFDLKAFSDSDYARASLNKKSITRAC